MKVLILSCNTGGGHNSCAKAIGTELVRRGHTYEFHAPIILSIVMEMSVGRESGIITFQRYLISLVPSTLAAR